MFRQKILLLIYLWMVHTNAAQFETHYLKAIKRAKDTHQIAKIRRDYERWKVTHAACLIELREQMLPVSCYEELTWSGGERRQKSQLSARLDRVCALVARRMTAPLRVHPALSRACAKDVREAIAIQAYRREGRSPAWSEN